MQYLGCFIVLSRDSYIIWLYSLLHIHTDMYTYCIYTYYYIHILYTIYREIYCTALTPTLLQHHHRQYHYRQHRHTAPGSPLAAPQCGHRAAGTRPLLRDYFLQYRVRVLFIIFWVLVLYWVLLIIYIIIITLFSEVIFDIYVLDIDIRARQQIQIPRIPPRVWRK